MGAMRTRVRQDAAAGRMANLARGKEKETLSRLAAPDANLRRKRKIRSRQLIGRTRSLGNALTAGLLRNDGRHGWLGLAWCGVWETSRRRARGLLVVVGNEEGFQVIPHVQHEKVHPVRTPQGRLLWQCQLRIVIIVRKLGIAYLVAQNGPQIHLDRCPGCRARL